MSTTPSDHIPLSRNHLWGPERRRLSAHLIQKALDALPGSRSSEHLPSKPYETIKRPYEQHRYTGKASKSYVPPAPVSERTKRKERPLTPSEGYGLGVFGMGFEVGGGEVEHVEREFFGQGGSTFFGLLPSEVRMVIYKWVLGGKVLHIVRWKNKLGHIVCECDRRDSDVGTREEDACIVAGCRGVKIQGGSGVYERVGEGSGSLLQLLQIGAKPKANKHSYSEAISLLYSTNTFNFDSMESFISFSNEILPRRFDSITSVTLDFSFDTSSLYNESSSNDVPRWERTWMILGSMKSLKSLKATIIWPRTIPAWSHELRLLEPLNMVGILGKDGKGGKGEGKDGERRPENKDAFEVRLRELTKEARGRGKARAYEVGKGFVVGKAKIVPAAGFDEITEEDLPFKVVRMKLEFNVEGVNSQHLLWGKSDAKQVNGLLAAMILVCIFSWRLTRTLMIETMVNLET
ncbi:uncharacterized protein Bfra_001773 [Botrytis fragariae]|uniref:DUF7730 domain-containing protein n=1 Tax=Botrytis fragariae TaxID=1964551 RepID=A0A8H6B0Z0_9HELO|nr:uncharacterized protein Bfra_001773 [Botrytis fragariae]KAF5877406.1 hypothetical protein Bfra_001773 [Botrytis fragariae]